MNSRWIRLCILAGFIMPPLLCLFNVGNISAQGASTHPVKIMPLGDSITEGNYGIFEPRKPQFIAGYRLPLYRSLINAGHAVNFVGSLQHGSAIRDFDYNHEGHRGFLDTVVAVRVYDWLVKSPADVVLLHIGTNGLRADASDVEKILNEIDRYDERIIVILARIINRRPYSALTTRFNNNVEAMARKRVANGDRIIIVDQERALNYSVDMADDIHPNDSGYNKMANVWLTALLGFFRLREGLAPDITSKRKNYGQSSQKLLR